LWISASVCVSCSDQGLHLVAEASESWASSDVGQFATTTFRSPGISYQSNRMRMVGVASSSKARVLPISAAMAFAGNEVGMKR